MGAGIVDLGNGLLSEGGPLADKLPGFRAAPAITATVPEVTVKGYYDSAESDYSVGGYYDSAESDYSVAGLPALGGMPSVGAYC